MWTFGKELPNSVGGLDSKGASVSGQESAHHCHILAMSSPESYTAWWPGKCGFFWGRDGAGTLRLRTVDMLPYGI